MQLLQNYYKIPYDKKVISLVILIMIIFFILRTIELDRIGTQNITYNHLNTQIKQLRITNSELYAQFLYESSLSRIEEKAGELGLTERATYYILRYCRLVLSPPRVEILSGSKENTIHIIYQKPPVRKSD